MARDDGVDVVVEMLTGCGVAVVVDGDWMRVVVVVVVAEGGGVPVDTATRIQHRTPRLRPRAPSTPTDVDDGGALAGGREMRLYTPYP